MNYAWKHLIFQNCEYSKSTADKVSIKKKDFIAYCFISREKDKCSAISNQHSWIYRYLFDSQEEDGFMFVLLYNTFKQMFKKKVSNIMLYINYWCTNTNY